MEAGSGRSVDSGYRSLLWWVEVEVHGLSVDAGDFFWWCYGGREGALVKLVSKATEFKIWVIQERLLLSTRRMFRELSNPKMRSELKIAVE